MRDLRLSVAAAVLLAGGVASATVCNLKVVTDASPDYYDMESMVKSITSKWSTDKEKCWAMFYWNHIARRQTQPMSRHGMALTDPIRQFNDYGHMMCSTISGANQAIWEHMGLEHKYWDISNHTVSEVFYDGRWHMYDNSLSAIYYLCDGVTVAGVKDIGKDGACAASGGKTDPGHIAKYHCACATSPNGFLIGADCARDLAQEYRCFNPNGLKYRYYYYDWDYGHRYILDLREGEVYTRYYRRMDVDSPNAVKQTEKGSYTADPAYYVPNRGKDPETVNPRYRIRGNGRWSFRPSLGYREYKSAIHSSENIAAARPVGLRTAIARKPAEVVYKVQSANVTTSQVIKASFFRKSDADEAKISISTDNGLHWKEVWKADATGEVSAAVKLIDEVNGAYETLIKIEMTARGPTRNVVLKSLEVEATTMLNSKTQPRLNLGKNTVYVGTGDPTESIVFWPELHGGKYKQHIAEEKNVKSTSKHIGYQGTIHPVKANEDGYLVYRMDAPGEITRVTFGGRFYNRAPGSRIDLLYSLDGKNWIKPWSLTDTKAPWDVIHYETVNIPKGHRKVWFKYLMNTRSPSPSGCSIYAVRMEANYLPADARFKPVEVTFEWSELQEDRSLVKRSHTQLVRKVPSKYTVNVGGTDHPVMGSLRVNLQGALEGVKYGYSDGKDAAGKKFIGRWVTYGKNLAVGRKYTLSAPSMTNWGAGDPDGKKLTDGVAGPPYSGGISYRYGAIWRSGVNPVITLDLGSTMECASFGMNLHGYPGWDALKGEIKDKVEVLVSPDGRSFSSLGFLKTDIRWKDLPANHMWTDEETLKGATFRLIPKKPVKTRFVQYKVTNGRFFDCTELEVLDSIEFEPFDLLIALPDER